jgi:DNA processing protein
VSVEELDEIEADAGSIAEARAALGAARRQLDLRVLDVRSSTYPAALAGLDGRPALMFLRGELVDARNRSFAIVGSRKPSEAGREAARRLAKDLALAGSLVVSGLAAGIDTAAHEGALDAGGLTLAIMGTGPAHISPSENRHLAERILARGGLLTQFPPGSGPTKTSFPARNALIAGMSTVSVLVEMSERSGTRIEANCAIAQGKQVLLWEPILGELPWAKDFATQPKVGFVSTSHEVIEIAGRCHE